MECSKPGCLKNRIKSLRVCSLHRQWNDIDFDVQLCSKPGCTYKIKERNVCGYHKKYTFNLDEICNISRCSYKKKPNMTVCGYHKRYNNIGNHIMSYMLNNPEYLENLEINPCLICGEDMGPNNPRQLCGKTHCYLEELL